MGFVAMPRRTRSDEPFLMKHIGACLFDTLALLTCLSLARGDGATPPEAADHRGFPLVEPFLGFDTDRCSSYERRCARSFRHPGRNGGPCSWSYEITHHRRPGTTGGTRLEAFPEASPRYLPYTPFFFFLHLRMAFRVIVLGRFLKRPASEAARCVSMHEACRSCTSCSSCYAVCVCVWCHLCRYG